MTTAQQVFGNTIRDIRKQRGMSQEELADKSNLHRTYVGGIERGERNVSLINILRLAHALNVLPADLLRAFNKEVMAELFLE